VAVVVKQLFAEGLIVC